MHRGAARWTSQFRLSSTIDKVRYGMIGGRVAQRAEELQRSLELGASLPFREISLCNLGNQHAMGQRPMSFFRDVLACATHTSLLNQPELFEEDVRRRAKQFLSSVPGGLGSYGPPAGLPSVRNDVAYYLGRRDGYHVDPSDVILTNGATRGIRTLLRLLLRYAHDAVMVPSPVHPLYRGLVGLLGGQLATFRRSESQGWAIESSELERSLEEARERGLRVSALVVVNPDNPTGRVAPHSPFLLGVTPQVLLPEEMEPIMDLCIRRHIVLLADEVYQDTVFDESRLFMSFKQAALDLGKGRELQMVSAHSMSHGFMGESGRRGGFLELFNVEEGIRKTMIALQSLSFCPNLEGQLVVSLYCRPPLPSDASFASFASERDIILDVAQSLHQLPGVRCHPIQGSLYCFPRIQVPSGAREAAEQARLPIDSFYCLSLLEEEGIALFPGHTMMTERPTDDSNTFHVRFTILTPEDRISGVLYRFGRFHKKFIRRFA